jgi:hypothetical protein
MNEIYLPARSNNGREIETKKIKQFVKSLAAVFVPITVNSQSAPYQRKFEAKSPGSGSTVT